MLVYLPMGSARDCGWSNISVSRYPVLLGGNIGGIVCVKMKISVLDKARGVVSD